MNDQAAPAERDHVIYLDTCMVQLHEAGTVPKHPRHPTLHVCCMLCVPATHMNAAAHMHAARCRCRWRGATHLVSPVPLLAAHAPVFQMGRNRLPGRILPRRNPGTCHVLCGCMPAQDHQIFDTAERPGKGVHKERVRGPAHCWSCRAAVRDACCMLRSWACNAWQQRRGVYSMQVMRVPLAPQYTAARGRQPGI